MRASDLGGQLESRATLIAEAVAHVPHPVVLIDGRSGSGKTTLAEVVVARIPGAQLVRLDDIYPGWDGLEAASEHVRDVVLAREKPGWRRWDWTSGAPAEWNPLNSKLPLVVEGCGVLSQANRLRADYGVWVELDEASRKARALERDGESYAPHWSRWAAQEDAFIAREHPQTIADLVIEERATRA